MGRGGGGEFIFIEIKLKIGKGVFLRRSNVSTTRRFERI